MAGPTPAALAIARDAVAAVADECSLHTADPGTTGASEVAGGSPAYARANVAGGFTAGDLTNPEVFNVPAATTVTHYGYWDGVTFLGGQALSSPESFGAQGTYTLNSAPVQAT